MQKTETNELECLEKSKNKFNKLNKLFENIKIEEKLNDKEIKEIIIKDKSKKQLKEELIKEIPILNEILVKKKTNKEINSLIDEIIIFESYSILKEVIINLKSLLECFNINDNIYSEIKTMDKEFKKIDFKISLDDIKKKIKYLNKFNFDIKEDSNKENKALQFFNLLNRYPNSIKWILNKNENDFLSLEKFIIDSDNNDHLTLSTFNLIDIKIIFEKLKKRDKSDDFIRELLNELNNSNKIFNYMNNFIYLENLNNKKDVYSQEYENFFININNLKFFIDYIEKGQKYELANIKFNEEERLNIYNEFLQNSFFAITHSIDKNNYNNKFHTNFKKIIDINNEINTFISLLNNKRNIILEHKNYELIIKEENNENNIYINENKLLKDIILDYKRNEEEEKNILIQKYSENEIIRLFYGRQLSNLYQLIKEKKYSDIKYFIPYKFNKLIKTYELKKEDEFEIKDYKFEKQLDIISKYFNKIFKDNNINIKNIYNENKIKVDIEYDIKSLYIKDYKNDQYEYDCINIFYSLTKNLPLFSNILVFNEETIEEEILSFLFRVIKCKSNCLFILIIQNINNNNNNKNKNLISLINKFMKEKENESLFLILFSQQIENIIFENIKTYKILGNLNQYQNGNMLKEIKEKLLEMKISSINSDICGAGKTKYIKEKISNNQNYIYFPIGGYLERNYLIKRLQKEIKIDIDKENVIHLDLSDTNYENIFKEFLFNFVIFNFFGYEEKILTYNYCSLKIVIKIELPNSYINYFDKYKMLKLITIEKTINIKENELKDLPVLKEYNKINSIKDPKTQIVSTILKMFKSKQISFKNPDLDSRKLINKFECDKIINEYLINNIQTIKNKNNYKPNFYQKKIFIEFLSSEFIKFKNCIHLDPKNFEDENILTFFKKLRINIIDSLIKNSIYFTYSPFDNIINEKINELSTIVYNDEREKKYDEFIEQLQNKMEDSIISYDKINPSILFFHDSDNDIRFSIISNDENDEILNQVNIYFDLINSYFHDKTNSRIETPLMLEKEGKLLDEILKIITEDKNIIKNIKDIVENNFKDFTFTIDNYIKMLLLIMRIRAGIPTILMGETGCGKTYLIKMFSLLYGKGIGCVYSKAFHSGITDKDINEFIQKTIEKNNSIEQKAIERIKKEVEDICKEEATNEENKNKEMNSLIRWFKNFRDFIKGGYKGYNKDEFLKLRINDIKNRKIIIYFDEVNTCNSLGLIKQLMCNINYRKLNNIPDRFDLFVLVILIDY